MLLFGKAWGNIKYAAFTRFDITWDNECALTTGRKREGLNELSPRRLLIDFSYDVKSC